MSTSVIKTWHAKIYVIKANTTFCGTVWINFWIKRDDLTSVKVLRLGYLKYEHCSKQYSVRHICIYKSQQARRRLIDLNLDNEIAFTLDFLLLCAKKQSYDLLILYIYYSNLNFVSFINPKISCRNIWRNCFSKVGFYVFWLTVFLLFSSLSIDVTVYKLVAANSVISAYQETTVLNILTVENWKKCLN